MEEPGDFQDWELLDNSDTEFPNSPKTPNYSNKFVDVEGDAEGIIRSDYFSLDSEQSYGRIVVDSDDQCSEKSSVQSGNPSWVDPSSDDVLSKVGFQGITFPQKKSSEILSDSASDESVSRRFSDLEENRELGFTDGCKREVGFEGIEENVNDCGESWSDSGDVIEKLPAKLQCNEGEGDQGFDNGMKIENDLGFSSESSMAMEGADGEGGKNSAEFVEAGGSEVVDGIGNVPEESVNSVEREKRGIIWWKLPFEVLKFCVFRVSPVWSISVAAALLGFVILKRRLHKMKQKSQSFALKITLDDKKVSQFTTRVARLNEAFSVVKRVPRIRPSLSAGMVTPWPVTSLR